MDLRFPPPAPSFCFGGGGVLPARGHHRRAQSETFIRLPDADLLLDPDADFGFSDIDFPSLSDDSPAAAGPAAPAAAAARSKERKIKYTSELERKVQTLQTEATTLSAQLTLLQRDTSGLTTENRELKLRLQAMEEQAKLRDALNDALREEVQRLKIATGQVPNINGSPFNGGLPQQQQQMPSYFSQPQGMQYFSSHQGQQHHPNHHPQSSSNGGGQSLSDSMDFM